MIGTRVVRRYSSRAARHFKVVVAGGGCGGCSVANRLAGDLRRGELCVIEPNESHYYQPMWTLVGGGIKKFEQSRSKMSSVLPSRAEWIRQPVQRVDPDKREVHLSDGERVTYDFLVVAPGVRLLYTAIEGALDALRHDPVVCSNYHPEYVKKTRPAFDMVKSGNAIFTFPNGPIKCPGAPQKIMYLFDDYVRRRGLRDQVRIMYNTSLPVVFGIKKYAAELMKVCQSRDLELNFRHALVKVDHTQRLAVFEHLDSKELKEFRYDFLHIAPPVSPHEFLVNSSLSLDGTGWVTVDKASLRHVKYPNVFALGDCSNAPTSKTAAAVANQANIVTQNLKEALAGRPADKAAYDGYTSCPLVTTYRSVIMAEFDYNGQPLETFPVDQGKERYSMYLMKAHLLPQVYWHGLIKGRWAGPTSVRKFFDLIRFS